MEDLLLSAAAKAKKQAQDTRMGFTKAKGIKGKTIVFCLPESRGVSYTFLKNFVTLMF